MKTPFYETHVKLGGKIVDFHGWQLPVQYTSIIDEHNTTRNAIGIFDVSHMGEIVIEGKDAIEFTNFLITNRFKKLKVGQISYSPMCNEKGGIVDDLLAYRYEDKAFLVVNAANTDKDFEHIKNIAKKYDFDVNIENKSSDFAQIAIQGPKAKDLMQELVDFNIQDLKYYHFIETKVLGIDVLLSRTGYTGEDGFEIYFSSKYDDIFEKLVNLAKNFNGKPAGLGARDTLRFEAGLMLYGNELREDITPLQANLKWTIKFKKKDFVGKEALLKEKEEGIKRKLFGLELLNRRIARTGNKVITDKGEGFISSGTFSPTLKKSLAMAYLPADITEDDKIKVLIHNSEVEAKITNIPFVEHRTYR